MLRVNQLAALHRSSPWQRPAVLLTGISGFLGAHTAIRLLENGYQVTGTLRSLDRADAIRTLLARHTPRVDNLRFAPAELTDERVWRALTKGMDYVQHVASPILRELPKHEDELILPARNGVLHVLQAAAANGVKRVVLTSSTSALMYGRPTGQESGRYDESAWTDVTNRADTTAYSTLRGWGEARRAPAQRPTSGPRRLPGGLA